MPARGRSGVLQYDAFDDVGDVLAAIGDRLQELVDSFILISSLVSGSWRNNFAKPSAAPVGVGLEPVDFATDFVIASEFAMLSSIVTAALTFSAQATQMSARRFASSVDRAEIVEKHAMRDVLHQVEDVVHAVMSW